MNDAIQFRHENQNSHSQLQIASLIYSIVIALGPIFTYGKQIWIVESCMI